MATFLLKTPRLYLRKYISEDYPLLIQLYTNWKWEGVDEEFAKQFLETVIQKQYEKGGGVFATFLRENDVYIGHCGLKYMDSSGEWHLSFRFLKSHWRNNFPAEAIKVCIEYGFNSLNVNEIIVDLQTKSKSAARTLISQGFRHRMTFEHAGETLQRYSIFS